MSVRFDCPYLTRCLFRGISARQGKLFERSSSNKPPPLSSGRSFVGLPRSFQSTEVNNNSTNWNSYYYYGLTATVAGKSKVRRNRCAVTVVTTWHDMALNGHLTSDQFNWWKRKRFTALRCHLVSNANELDLNRSSSSSRTQTLPIVIAL